MNAADTFGIVLMLFLIISSVAIAARAIKIYLNKEVSKTLVIVLTLPIMLLFSGLVFLIGFICNKLGIKSDLVQMPLAGLLIAYLDFLAFKIPFKKNIVGKVTMSNGVPDINRRQIK